MTTPSDSRSDRKTLRKTTQPLYDSIYKAYPIHQDYGGGFEVFLDLLCEGVDPDFLLKKAESYARNVDPSRLKWVPHLKTWLRNRRFEDEDLFTDQRVANREWFMRVYREGDVAAVENRLGFIYTQPPVPDGVVELAKWHMDHRKVWIGYVARHVLYGEPLPE